jgi:hypothetical protein
MVCSTCGLDNDPSAEACARCNMALDAAPIAPPAYQRPAPAYRRPAPVYQQPAPAYEQPAPAYEPPRSRDNRLPLIAAVVVVAVLAAVAIGVVLSRRDDDAPPAAAATTQPAQPTEPVDPPPATVAGATTDPGAALDQAKVVDALLDRSISSRNKLNQAIQRVGQCTDLSGALADMRAVGDERRAQLAEIGAADLSALATGETLRGTWSTALRSSLAADEAYVSWAEPALSAGCRSTGSRNAAYSRGRSASTKAGAAKNTFLAAWNPVAAGMGLATRSRDQI